MVKPELEKGNIIQIRALSAIFRAEIPADRTSGRPWKTPVIDMLESSA